jgi:hypothetical protein
VEIDVQLDLIFAVAHDEGKNPVTVSKSGNIPEAGSREAEMILGRQVAPALSEKNRRGSQGAVKRVFSRQKSHKDVQHAEVV